MLDYETSPLGPIARPLLVAVVLAFAVQVAFGGAWATIPLAFFGLDAMGRLRDYYTILYDDDRHPYVHIDQLKTSWCSRGVALALYGHDAARVYEVKGYRWYHLLPDNIARRLFTQEFWRGFLFGRMDD